MRYPLIFACSIALAAGAEYDPTEVLRRATEKALASAKETPNYTCVETVSRDYFEPAAVSLPRTCSVLQEQRRHPTRDLVLRMYSADRLRLDVTLAGIGEIYSWAGEPVRGHHYRPRGALWTIFHRQFRWISDRGF